MIAPVIGTIMRYYDVWWEPDHIRLLWIAMLGMADNRGAVDASVPGLARMASLPVEKVEAAIESLTASGMLSKEWNGPRFRWQLHCLEALKADEVRASAARRQAAKRARDKGEA